MNLGKGRWHSKYICDKCGQEILYIKQKGFVGITHYSKATRENSVFIFSLWIAISDKLKNRKDKKKHKKERSDT